MARILRFFILTLLAGTALILWSCQAEFPSRKYNGISLVASRDSLQPEHIDRLLDVNANSVALMPYAFMKDSGNPQLIFNIERQWFGERVEGVEQAIFLLKQRNLNIMLKPHIWIRNGQFTGDLNFSSEQDWEDFERSYRKYILLYAEVAEKYDLEIFCIGTELYEFVFQRPQFWQSLIQEVKRKYRGKLVYAENWDKANKTEIWKELDYIGIDAYFPLNGQASPGKDQIKAGWLRHKHMLEELSSSFNKPVLFTEYGYRSRDYALKEPWNSERGNSVINQQIQARALEVIYEEFWKEKWFHGGFLWKWHQQKSAGGMDNDRFTPQNKPAEHVIKDYYGRFRN